MSRHRDYRQSPMFYDKAVVETQPEWWEEVTLVMLTKIQMDKLFNLLSGKE